MVHTSSFITGTRALLRGVKGLGRGVDHQPPATSKFSNVRAIPLFPLCASYCMLWSNLYLHNSETADIETSQSFSMRRRVTCELTTNMLPTPTTKMNAVGPSKGRNIAARLYGITFQKAKNFTFTPPWILPLSQGSPINQWCTACEIWDSHSSVKEDSSFLGHYEV
jgi:hypothetical protein